MNKTLTITIHQDPTIHLDNFLHDWQLIGTFENISDMEYKLISHDGKVSMLTISQEQIIITGDIPSKSFMLIDTLSKDCESDKVIEGEVIDKNQTQQPNFNNSFGQGSVFTQGAEFKMPLGVNAMFKFSKMSKLKLSIILVLALPLILIMIPVVFIIAIVKIILFKIKLK
ncbi:MAG: hypothetical protein L3J53_00535 [Proteobacteria bacterium]|nr:hypothetical protein [Pseudomonadota bacterium]